AETRDAAVRDAVLVGRAANAGELLVDRATLSWLGRRAAAGHVAVVVRVDDELGAIRMIRIGDDRLLPPGARATKRRVQDVTARAVVDPKEALVGVDRLGLAVSLEVEDGRSGLGRRHVLGRLGPPDPGRLASGSAARAVDVENAERV